jgi:CBS domain-containing protein
MRSDKAPFSAVRRLDDSAYAPLDVLDGRASLRNEHMPNSKLGINRRRLLMEAANQMIGKLVVVSPHDSLAKAKALMDSRNFRHVPVVEDGKLVGILSNNDIRWQGHLTATVAEAMTPNPITVTPKTTIHESARLMLRRKINAVLVVDRGTPVGIITTSDILKLFLETARSEQMAPLLAQAVGHGHMEF